MAHADQANAHQANGHEATTTQATDYQANVSLWQNCNLKCAYCFARPTPPPRSWSGEIDENLEAMAAFFAGTGRWTLDISGGEPTIHPGFGHWCHRLAADGHHVRFFTNGVEPLWEVFPDGDVSCLGGVTFSFHPTHDRHPKHREMFTANIDYLRERDIQVGLNFVMYPEHESTVEDIRNEFGRPDIDLQFHPFQGESEGRVYPGAYTDDEMADFEEIGDIRARYLMEHGFFRPTGRLCRAGSETFYIAMRTDGVYTCEQLQRRPLVKYTDADAAETFRRIVAPEPQPCPATRCTCRLTVDQENFLRENDKWDMSNYAAWEAVSHPLVSDESLAERDRRFVAELGNRLTGDTVAVWAAGVHTVVLLRRLAENGFDMSRIVAIVDVERFKQGKKVHGHTVLSPEQFIAEWGSTCSDILISSRAFESEIAAELTARFGDRFPLMRLYDGGFENPYEYVDDMVSDLTGSTLTGPDLTRPGASLPDVDLAAASGPSSSAGPVPVQLGPRR